jgi:DnaJ-class molecular chaperone
MEWQKCPVCNGSGNVPCGFYNPIQYESTGTYFGTEMCRRCQGQGTILKPEGITEIEVTANP